MHGDDGGEVSERAWDDVTGAELGIGRVKKARAEEIVYFRGRAVYKCAGRRQQNKEPKS